ncbi:low molecular weight protein-tyrosine-phosphatase [uncultured Prochlorococcus sp.]|jgi:protein-tyrosine phosphatase|uniref:low molecular weight protein-tyrosine-phosphatase n=1 Tax=uncultured Prochlorococcus sp. TaxID=159733 RepID=UPI000C62E6CF|nr:protein tyrosine phosphatase [Prochlorococcus sp. MED105]RCL50800.1 MAG: low molecular weight phosphotyrosine protein phosphatase [Prochlorococcus sp. MED-G72]|tara:strand:+ start:933 stop:1406 length:474 start_codon:yes stop_codon:yes gene_type:complete
MKKQSVLFVCLGNICRSPAAEAIFLDLINKKGLNDSFIVDSAGTGSWHIGKKADTRMRIASRKRGVEIFSRARQINSNDFEKFNYIVAMDDSNYENIIDMKSRKSLSDFASIKKIQNFRSIFQEIEVPDPYFGGDEGFDNVLDILEDSVSGFLDTIY